MSTLPDPAVGTLRQLERPALRRAPPLAVRGPAGVAGRAASRVAEAWRAAVAPPMPAYLERVLVRDGGRLRVARLAEVDWIEGAGKYVDLHLGAERQRLRASLGGLEHRLDPRRFVRVHRSAIVNVDRVAELAPRPSGSYELRLASGATLTVSRSHRRRLLQLMGRA